MNSDNRGRILVLDEDEGLLEQTCATIETQIPNAWVRGALSVDQFCSELEEHSFDLVIIDFDLASGNPVEVLHQAKLQDYEPAIMVVSAAEDPRTVASLFNVGCHRYIYKEGDWLPELGPAIRHSLRVRRLEEENWILISKLTEANQLLEDKNKRLDEFSATLSHDIRGLISGLSMRLDYIIDVASDELSPKLSDLLSSALRATDRVNQIVQGTYEFAKLGRESLKKSPVELVQVVRDVIDDMQFEDRLDIQVGIDDLPVIWANEGLMRRVFINLISNAVKYADSDQIVINFGVERYFKNSLAQFCEIYVEDNGPGIATSELANVFRMFWQEDREKADGVGIGLAVVQRIVDLHMGSVDVCSEVGQGTKFLLTLPLEEIAFVK